MSILAAILVTGLGTYFSRAVFILAFANRRLPPTLVRALEYVAPSVLGALVMTLLLGPDGTTKVGTAELVALLVAALVAWKGRNAVVTLVAGMGVYWLARAVI